MTLCYLLLAAGAVCLAFYLSEKLKRYSVRAVFLKSLVSALFLTLALWGWYDAGLRGKPSLLGVFLCLGLLFGLLGDVWLDLKLVFPREDTAFTYAGFSVFGIGHLLYITGMLLQYYPGRRPAYWAIPLVLGLLFSLVTVLLEKPMKLRYGKFRPTVLTYGAILFSMVLMSGSLALLHRWQVTTLNLIFAGGILFALSDLVLSGTYFGEGHERPLDLILNYLFYYSGQFLIAWSLAFVK